MQAYGEYLIVESEVTESTSPSGLIITNKVSTEKTGVIFSKGDYADANLEIGQKILFENRTDRKIVVDGAEYDLITPDNIIGLLS